MGGGESGEELSIYSKGKTYGRSPNLALASRKNSKTAKGTINHW